MIINLPSFVQNEKPYWDEMATLLDWIESNPDKQISLDQTRRLHYLYERAASDLIRLSTFASAPEVSAYLEGLVARAYGEIHEVREKRANTVLRFVFKTFPRTFRKHWRPFALSTFFMVIGTLFGAFCLYAAPESRSEILPEMALVKPEDRVAAEKADQGKHLEHRKADFAAMLITHNIKCGLLTLAFGMTYGVGSVIFLFYNGFILGAVSYDYIHAGETFFMIGWLLPHGSIEIPSLIISGQTAFVLAAALIGSRSKRSLFARLRDCRDDVVTLTGGFAMLLIWAGITEAFFSQYHEPVIPYWVKIAFGCLQFSLLCLYLGTSGLKKDPEEEEAEPKRLVRG